MFSLTDWWTWFSSVFHLVTAMARKAMALYRTIDVSGMEDCSEQQGVGSNEGCQCL